MLEENYSLSLAGFTGGRCLARWILDHPYEVAGKTVLDVGSGSGLVAIACAMAGAKETCALDNDPVAIEVIHQNAKANNVSLETKLGSFMDPRVFD